MKYRFLKDVLGAVSFSCRPTKIMVPGLYRLEAIFSCDLRDVQYPYVLLCVTYPRIVGIRFHSATRHVYVASIARSRDCRNTRTIERERGMSSHLFLYLKTETCIIKIVLFHLRCLGCFDLSIYTPRVFEFRTFRLAFIVW